jgi:hypothetical protein
MKSNFIGNLKKLNKFKTKFFLIKYYKVLLLHFYFLYKSLKFLILEKIFSILNKNYH